MRPRTLCPIGVKGSRVLRHRHRGSSPTMPPLMETRASPPTGSRFGRMIPQLAYQKRFDELHKLAAAGDWAAVRDYKVSGSNSYSKLVARYQQDLLALHAVWEAAQ
jgi:hypothetical protein